MSYEVFKSHCANLSTDDTDDKKPEPETRNYKPETRNPLEIACNRKGAVHRLVMTFSLSPTPNPHLQGLKSLESLKTHYHGC
jgi:hypothetical protein